MDYELTAEQRELREVVHNFVARELQPRARPPRVGARGRKFPGPKIWGTPRRGRRFGVPF